MIIRRTNRVTTERRQARPLDIPLEAFASGHTLRRGRWLKPVNLKEYRQHYRVADESLNQYELYVGEDQMPDWDASDQPVATSVTLPITFTPATPSSGDTMDLYVVCRKRNKYNLISFNQYPTIIRINSLNEEEEGPLTNPTITKLFDGNEGELIVHARYPYGEDRNQADTWEVHVKRNTTPDPDTEDPDVVQSFLYRNGPDYLMKATVDGLVAGGTYKVIVSVIRSDDSDGQRGTSAVSTIVLAETIDLDADQASAFGS